MKKYIFIFIFFGLYQIGYGQKKPTIKEIDSIFKIIYKTEYFNSEGVTKAIELYYKSKDIDYKIGQIKALKLLTDIEAGSANFAKAYEYVQELKSVSLSIEDYKSYITACNFEAKILFNDHNYALAKSVLSNARKYLPKIKNLEDRIDSKTEIDIYWWWTVKNSQSPKDSYKDSLVLISKNICADAVLIKNPISRASRILFAANYAAATLVDMGRMAEAEKYLTLAERQIKYMGLNTFPSTDYFAAKGDFEYHNKKNNINYLDSALVNYNKALKMANKLGYDAGKMELYPKIAKVYKDKKDLKNQNLYLEKGVDLKDNYEINHNNNLNELKPKISEVRKKNSEDGYLTYISKILLGVFFILIAVGGIALIYKRRRIQKKAHPVIITQQTLLPDIEAENISVTDLLELVAKNDDLFYAAILKAYPGFREKLIQINPVIKASDIEFCALIKLNLDTKQIAQAKETTVKSVESKKYRIRKKLDIPADVDLYVWMSKL